MTATTDRPAGTADDRRDDVAVIDDLHVAFATGEGTVEALRGVDLRIGAGEVVAIVGESGSGKSVLAGCLLGLPPRARRTTIGGSVTVAGIDMLRGRDRDRRQVRRHLLGAVFQDPLSSLNPAMRIGRQLTERGIDRDRALQTLRDARVPDAERRLRQWPHQLSGGQRQRVMVAMALGADGRLPPGGGRAPHLDVVHGAGGAPALIVADEPTTALDVSVQAQIVALFDRLRREHGCAIVLVTHDLGVAASVADRIVVLYAGRVCEDGPAAAVLGGPRHPYAAALLGARLTVDGPAPGAAVRLEGRPPDPLHLPAGCAFAPRCPVADERCGTQPPLHTDDGRRAACHHPIGAAPGTTASVPARAAAPGQPDVPATAPGAPGARDVAPAPGAPDALRLTGITKAYRVGGGASVQAVAGVDLRVPAGGAVALVGESGCGKSTLLRIATGLLAADAGSVSWDGAPADRRAVHRPQLVFQDAGSSLTPWLSIRRQIEERLAARAVPRPQRAGLADELLHRVGLDGRAARAHPRQLSGGQRQRAAIARALASEPSLLICDEPVSALDASLAVRVLELLEELRRELGLAILLVTHDLAVARRIGDEVAVMYLGAIVERAPADALFDDPRHPYTRGLLAAVPTTEPGRLAPTLDGEPPSPQDRHPGCSFADRCPDAIEHCRVAPPPVSAVSVGAPGEHELRCHVHGAAAPHGPG